MQKPLSRYKAIFFDVGDTLMTIPAASAIIQQFLSLRSLHREELKIGELFNQAFKQFYYGKELNPEELCSPESDRVFWTKVYRFILDELGAHTEWTEDEIHHCCHELYELFTSPKHYCLFDDVKDSLEALREAGFKLGVISNFSPTLKSILLDKGILHYFDPVIVSTEVGLEKPNPAIFQLALRESGLMASEVLYIGDHDQNDVWAPQQIGMDAVKILRYDYMTGSGIYSLKELLK
jgi:putative hydrolase of the HAD superfamily